VGLNRDWQHDDADGFWKGKMADKRTPPKGKMVLSLLHLTLLVGKIDGMVQR
jgi:hypothetical protein